MYGAGSPYNDGAGVLLCQAAGAQMGKNCPAACPNTSRPALASARADCGVGGRKTACRAGWTGKTARLPGLHGTREPRVVGMPSACRPRPLRPPYPAICAASAAATAPMQLLMHELLKVPTQPPQPGSSAVSSNMLPKAHTPAA